MKKIILTLAALVAVSSISFAQGLKEATDAAQGAQEAYEAGNYEGALNGFKSALNKAAALGDEGKELVGQCNEAIPTVMMSIAKKKANNRDYEGAVAQLEEIVATADIYKGSDALIMEADGLIPTVMMSQGAEYLRESNFDAAVAVYQKLSDKYPQNGEVAFNLGQALSKTGDTAGALEAFKKSITLGYNVSDCESQIATLNLKSVLADYKSGKLSKAVDGAAEVIATAGDNASLKGNAIKIIGGCIQSAAVSKKNPDEAVKYYNKLAEVDPSNSNLASYAFYIGYAYYQNKNNGAARPWLTKGLKDPKNGANAKKILDTLK